MNSITRPTSITIISWFLIGSAIFAAIVGTVILAIPAGREMLRDVSALSLPGEIAYALFYLASMLVIGFGMLKARNWARWLYVGIVPLAEVVYLLLREEFIPPIGRVVIYMVIVFFLFQPTARGYFRQARERDQTA